jgi:magnesium transporter
VSQEVEEIESSSRLYADCGAIYLNMPVVTRNSDDAPALSFLGFVLSPHYIVTVRSGPLPLNDSFIDRALQADPHPNDASHVFLLLLEGIVARGADSLERIRHELNAESRRLFQRKSLRPGSGNNSAALAETLRSLGQAGDLLPTCATAWWRSGGSSASSVIPRIG